MPDQPTGVPPHPPGSNPLNGQTPSVGDMVAPRPIPTAWNLKIVEFDTPSGTKHMVELSFYSATGTHRTYWDPASAKRLASDIRGAGAEAAQKESGIQIARTMPPDPPTTRG